MRLDQIITDHAPADGAPRDAPRRRVLVVDDSAPQRMVLAKLLRGWGYAVVEAGSGAAALEILRHSDVDMILSDWVMPGMSGVELCRAFRSEERASYVYFVLLTSKSEKEDVALGLDSGADDFLTKPVSSAELRARLMAGERIVGMQAELRDKNDLLSDAFDELRRVYEGLNRDLGEAQRFQQSLMPDRVCAFDGGRVSLMFRPSGHVGGDFIGLFRASDSRIGLYAMDVSGHGVASALLAARIAGYLSGTTPDQNIALTADGSGGCTIRPPEEVCGRLNDLMLSQMETDLYLTMLLADCDLATGAIRMVQAGHPNPAIQRRSGGIERPGAGGLPVGLLPGARWDGFATVLSPGDRLLALSDGITECPGPDAQDFGEAGVAAFLARNADVHGPDLLDALSWELDRFSGLQTLPDDVSCAMLEFFGAPSAQRA